MLHPNKIKSHPKIKHTEILQYGFLLVAMPLAYREHFPLFPCPYTFFPTVLHLITLAFSIVSL